MDPLSIIRCTLWQGCWSNTQKYLQPLTKKVQHWWWHVYWDSDLSLKWRFWTAAKKTFWPFEADWKQRVLFYACFLAQQKLFWGFLDSTLLISHRREYVTIFIWIGCSGKCLGRGVESAPPHPLEVLLQAIANRVSSLQSQINSLLVWSNDLHKAKNTKIKLHMHCYSIDRLLNLFRHKNDIGPWYTHPNFVLWNHKKVE